MATGLVKWWRARFLAGYKPFSVVGGTAEGSDSEELLAGGVGTPCNSSPLPASVPHLITPETPPVTIHTPVAAQVQANHNEEQQQQQQPTVPNTTRQLSFEEFECDVSVAEGNRRRQEFSFTLYDFDGHGKITKDDIAGLVTTIYDTLGASIQVPPCGSKTIKVKLTVSPDKSTNQSVTNNSNNGKSTNLPLSSTPCCHVKPVSACGHATHANRRLPRRRRVPRNRAEPQRVLESHSEEDADNVPPPVVNTTKQEELRKRVGPLPHFPSPYSNSSEGDVSDDSDVSPTITPLTPLVNNHRKRSGSMQRQQLLEIIQANMEKNNLSFHASRKRHQSEHLRVPLDRSFTDPSSPYTQRSRQSSGNRQQASYHKPVREYSHHTTSLPKLSSKCRTNIRKSRNTQNTTNGQRNTTPVLTGKSLRNNLQTDITINPNILNTQDTQQQNNHNNVNNINNQRNDVEFVQQNKSSKKHQLKHATREQDQARAMAQVVRWLEREFSQNSASSTSGRRHVHEHIHHHYHHYHAEALV